MSLAPIVVHGRIALVAAGIVALSFTSNTSHSRPAPGKALLTRLVDGPEIIGIVHWGLNTYTDKEWGWGDADPSLLRPAAFDAAQIVQAAKDGGLGGLVIVAKHHDGFCLWPTKTTDYNISKSPFRNGKGDYVKEMEDACRKAGLKFGIYVSPWDRHDADYARDAYVDKYHAQIKELAGGDYGEVFEFWFDGANGGDGFYGGARENRTFASADDYYRYDELFRLARELQPLATIFAGENDNSDFRWPGNERGILDPDSRATVDTVGGFANKQYGNPGYKAQIDKGSPDGAFFRVCEADFPLRKGWFWHAGDDGATKSAAYLTKLYLSSVGNGGTMNIGLAPNTDGRICDADIDALKGFNAMRNALFAHEVVDGGEAFNVVAMSEDISRGELVDEWEFIADGKVVLRGESIGRKRIRLLPAPCMASSCELRILKSAGKTETRFTLYRADEELVNAILSATALSGETDTAKWMTLE